MALRWNGGISVPEDHGSMAVSSIRLVTVRCGLVFMGMRAGLGR
jgi:hypothetical protein